MAKGARINLRMEVSLVKQMKKYAERYGTTVSAIVDKHFRDLIEVDRQARAVVTTRDAEQA